MLCPNCQKEMIVVEREQVELDYCIFCHGFWFDNLEWNILAKKIFFSESYDIGDLYSIPKLVIKEKPKKCPICSKVMDKFLYYDVVLDRCPNKHGVWFDANEASKVIGNALNDSGKKTAINFLGETFYK